MEEMGKIIAAKNKATKIHENGIILKTVSVINYQVHQKPSNVK
jgi:hypothetical protein